MTDCAHHTSAPLLHKARSKPAEPLRRARSVREVQVHAANAARQPLIHRSEVLLLLQASDLAERAPQPMPAALDERVGDESSEDARSRLVEEEGETLPVLPCFPLADPARLRSQSTESASSCQD